MLSRLALLADTASQFWNDWVMSYGDLQELPAFLLVRRMTRRSIRFTDFDGFGTRGKTPRGGEGARYLLLLVGILALAIGVTLWRPHGGWRGLETLPTKRRAGQDRRGAERAVGRYDFVSADARFAGEAGRAEARLVHASGIAREVVVEDSRKKMAPLVEEADGCV